MGLKARILQQFTLLLSLITEAIPLKLIQILQSFPQSHNDANSSSFMALWKKPHYSLIYRLDLVASRQLPQSHKANPKRTAGLIKKDASKLKHKYAEICRFLLPIRQFTTGVPVSPPFIFAPWCITFF